MEVLYRSKKKKKKKVALRIGSCYIRVYSLYIELKRYSRHVHRSHKWFWRKWPLVATNWPKDGYHSIIDQGLNCWVLNNFQHPCSETGFHNLWNYKLFRTNSLKKRGRKSNLVISIISLIHTFYQKIFYNKILRR